MKRLARELSVLLILFTIPAITLAQTADEPNLLQTIAVLSFRVEGLSESAGEALAHIVRSEMLDSDRITLVDRDRVSTILAEQGFILAGGCYDVSCLVEAGRVLGVERVVTGSVNQIGRKYMVEIRAANVMTAKIEALETTEFYGDVEDLTDPVRDLARRLIAKLANRPGVFRIETVPEASSVEINGVPIGFAPLQIRKPGGVKYELRAVRIGYQTESRELFLAEGDTVEVLLELRHTRRVKTYREPTVHFWVSGGFPLNQASNSLDSRITWGTGESLGAALSFGTRWRLRLGAYSYTSIIDDIEESVMTGLREEPMCEAFVIHSALMHMMGSRNFAPYFGVGVAALERSITVYNTANISETRSTTFEVGWLLMLGVEVSIYKNLAVEIEMVHARNLSTGRAWQDPREPTPEYWEDSFAAFDSFTVARFNIGLLL